MTGKFNGLKAKRTDVYKGEILISRRYRISDKIHIELIKLAMKKDVNLSCLVRQALKEFINSQNQK